MSALLSLIILGAIYFASCHPTSGIKYEQNLLNNASDSTVHTSFNRSVSICKDDSPLCHLTKSNHSGNFKEIIGFMVWLSEKDFSKGIMF